MRFERCCVGQPVASNEQMDRFLRGESKPTREPKQASPRKRGKRPPAVSDKQRLVNEYLRGVREAFIFLQNRLDPDGARCWNCGRKARRLDLHHVIPRGRGGHHTVSNLELWCRDCHSKVHGEPRFGGTA